MIGKYTIIVIILGDIICAFIILQIINHFTCTQTCHECGTPDGCGGICSGTCRSGSTCINKKCISSCIPTCGTCGGICQCSESNTCVANTCVNSLLYNLRPVIYLNTAEKFFPTSIEEMIQVSSLTLGGGPILMAQGTVNMDNIASLNTKFDPTASPPGHDLRLNVSNDSHGGHNTATIDEVPVYVYSYETDTSIIAQYIFIYNYNGAQKIAGMDFGQHPGDIEHISVFIDKTTEKITQIYFAEHGTGDGMMVQASDIIFEGDRPRIYSARWSHASYPKAGKWPVKAAHDIYNDMTDDTGVHWYPNTIVPIDDKTPWNQFNGNFGGNGGPRSPLSQGWWGNGN